MLPRVQTQHSLDPAHSRLPGCPGNTLLQYPARQPCSAASSGPHCLLPSTLPVKAPLSEQPGAAGERNRRAQYKYSMPQLLVSRGRPAGCATAQHLPPFTACSCSCHRAPADLHHNHTQSKPACWLTLCCTAKDTSQCTAPTLGTHACCMHMQRSCTQLQGVTPASSVPTAARWVAPANKPAPPASSCTLPPPLACQLRITPQGPPAAPGRLLLLVLATLQSCCHCGRSVSCCCLCCQLSKLSTAEGCCLCRRLLAPGGRLTPPAHGTAACQRQPRGWPCGQQSRPAAAPASRGACWR